MILRLLFFIVLVFYFPLPCVGLQAEASEQRYRLRQLRFEGHAHFNDKKLEEQCGLQAGQTYLREEFVDGFERVLAAYREAGFVFAELTPDALPAETGNVKEKPVSITVRIVEGKQVRVGVVTLKIGSAVAPRFSETDIRQVLGLREGTRFTQAALEGGIEQIQQLYSEHGYPKVEVEPTGFQFVSARGSVDFQLNVREGSPIQIGEVKVTGLKKTKKRVVLREILVKSGERFDQRKIDRSYRRLRNLGYFYSINPNVLEASEKADIINFHARVTEARTGRLSGVIGYAPPASDVDAAPQVTGVLEARETNLLGTGRQVSFYWKTGLRKTLRFAYEEPWIAGKPIAAGVGYGTVAQRNPYTEAVSEEQYARLSGKANFGRFFEGVLTVGYIRLNVPEAGFVSGGATVLDAGPEPSVSGALPVGVSKPDAERSAGLPTDVASVLDASSHYKGTKYSLTIELTRDTRDYFLNPTRGRRDSLAFEVSRSDFRLRKVWLSLQQYFPTWQNQTVALGLHGAVAWGTRFPPTELFYLGGANTLRGYDEDWFSGPRRVHTSLEYRFLVGRSSQVFIFTDMGAVTLVERPSVFERLRIGYGFGARLESRGGILRLNYGLAAGESVLRGKIHVNLGASF